MVKYDKFTENELNACIEDMIQVAKKMDENKQFTDAAIKKEICKLADALKNDIIKVLDEHGEGTKYKLYRVMYNPDHKVINVIKHVDGLIDSIMESINDNYDFEVELIESKLLPNDGKLIVMPLGPTKFDIYYERMYLDYR